MIVRTIPDRFSTCLNSNEIVQNVDLKLAFYFNWSNFHHEKLMYLTYLALAYCNNLLQCYYFSSLQGVSQTLPKTAYLKFIDYWLIFCLIVPIAVFLTEIAWELDHNKKERESVQIRKNWLSEKPEQIRIPYQRPVQFLLIGLTIAFTLGYSALAFSYYNTLI